ncbi:MAG: AAA family ATPase [Pseudomonadota bacterium]|nr:AAA family ATPase [Pseudomonadota bacterium]
MDRSAPRVSPDARPHEGGRASVSGSAVGPASGSAAPFVGRCGQLASLGAALGGARREPVVRIVDGRSGVGKSTLVHTFLRGVTREDPAVIALFGRCLPRREARSSALDSLVDSLARFLRTQPAQVQEAVVPRHADALLHHFPVLGGVERIAFRCGAPGAVLADPAEQRRRVIGALRELLVRVGERWPLVLFIDDVHWSDADTAALWAEVLRPPQAPPMLLVLACRREDLSCSPLLARMLELARDEQDPLDIGFVHVDELSAEDARTLARALAPSQGAAEHAEHIVAEAGGDPYQIDQLALAPRALDRAGGPGPTLGSGGTLDAVVRERVTTLSPPARRLLLTLAVASGPIARSIAHRAAGLDPGLDPGLDSGFDSGLDSGGAGPLDLDALARAHLARTDAGCLEIWHDRVRASVLGEQERSARDACHLRLAAAMEQAAEPDAAALSAHLVAAGDVARAAPWCVRAGDAAMAALAFERAVGHYRDALLHGRHGQGAPSPGTATPLELQRRLAGALAAAGRGVESARVQLAAAPLAPPAEAYGLRAEASLELLLHGQIEEGRAALIDALGRAGLAWPESPWQSLVSVLWRRAWLWIRGDALRRRAARAIEPSVSARIDAAWSAAAGLATVDPLRSADFHARGLLLALRAGDRARIARAFAMELLRSAAGGSRAQARTRRLACESEALAAELDDPRTTAGSLLHRGIASFLCGEFLEARALLERADEELRARCVGGTWERATLDRAYLRVLASLGDLRAILPLTRAHPLVALSDDAPEGLIDDLDARLLAQPGPCGAGAGDQPLAHLLATAEVDLYEGRPAEAWNRVARAWPGIVKARLLREQVSRVEGAFLRGRCSLAAQASLPRADPRRAELLAIADAEIRALRDEDVAWASALASLLEASRARIAGRPEAPVSLTLAAERLDAVGMRLHAMAARLRAAEWAGLPSRAARAAMEEHGIRDPDRMARLYVPEPARAPRPRRELPHE